MSAGHKNYKYLLVELLEEDQEPFNLNNYISDRRRSIQLYKLPDHHPKHDVGGSKSKLSDFLYPSTRTTTRTRTGTGSVFLSIPARTSDLLSKASMRIKRRHSKPRKQMKYIGVGLFSSVLKKLKDRDHQSKKMEFSVEVEEEEGDQSSRRSFRKSFGWSPLSSFRFSPSSGRRSPVSSWPMPIVSPTRRQVQKKENIGLKKYSKRHNKKEEKEENTSPISVLDRPSFEKEEDDDGDHNAHYNSSFPNSHSAKEEELLCKLRRFEKVVNLDPIELEKTVVQQLYYHNETETSLDNDIDNKQQTYELEENAGVVGNKMEYYCLVEKEEEKEEYSSTNNIDHLIHQMVLMINDQLMNQWTRYDQEEEREEIVMQIEVAIFGLLVEELSADLLVP